MSCYHPVTLKKMLLVFMFCLLWSYVSQCFIYCFVFPVWKEEKENVTVPSQMQSLFKALKRFTRTPL